MEGLCAGWVAGELVLLSSALSCTALLQGQQLVACIPAAPLLIPASCLPASPLSTGLDCTALSCLLYCLQNWLYEEGEDETKSVYIAKLAEVQQLGGPVEARAANAAALPAAADSLRRACKVGGFPLLPGGWLQNAASRQLRALPWPGQLVVGSPTHCPLFALLSPTHPPALILTLALTPCPAAELPGRAERAPHRPPGGGRQAAGGGRVSVGAGLAGREGGPAEKAGQGGLGSARLGKMGGAWLLVCLLGNVSSSWACHASALLPSAALPSPACLAAL